MKTESSRETSLKKDHGAKSRHEGTSVGGGARQPMVASGGQGMGRRGRGVETTVGKRRIRWRETITEIMTIKPL